MNKYTKIFIFPILFVSLFSQKSQACTTFCLDHGKTPVFGRNFDWFVGDGLVIINKRGVKKASRASSPEASNRLIWTSKYGSATFNQYGREFPLGGINESGLVLETMILKETQYPVPDSRPGIGILQLVQYQLDNFATIEEVIAEQSRIRVSKTGVPGLHVLVCDRTGSCATIEFLGGKLIYHHKKRLPIKTLTNNIYAESIDFWKNKKIPKFDENKSVERFINAADMVMNYVPKESEPPIEYAFNIFKRVANDTYTQWQIVYDVKNLVVYFRTLENQKVRHFSLQSFNFSCATPVKVLDINANLSGDITEKFVDYTYQINRNLIGQAYGKMDSTRNLPDYIVDGAAIHPELTFCVE